MGPYTAAVALLLTSISADSLVIVENTIAIIFILEIGDLLLKGVFEGAFEGKAEMKLIQGVSKINERLPIFIQILSSIIAKE